MTEFETGTARGRTSQSFQANSPSVTVDRDCFFSHIQSSQFTHYCN